MRGTILRRRIARYVFVLQKLLLCCGGITAAPGLSSRAIRPMARPRKPPADRRTVSLSCRLTPAERLKVEHDALRAGLSASDYIRTLVLTGRIVVHENRTLDYQTYDQLRRIGVNLNQLARLANRTGKIPYELLKITAVLEQVITSQVTGGAGHDRAGDGDGA